MMDFQFKPGHPPVELTENFARNEDDVAIQALYTDYQRSWHWLWYSLPENRTTLFGQRAQVFWSMPLNHADPAVGRFMYLPERGVGVATVWASNHSWRSNPRKAKEFTWGDPSRWQPLLKRANLRNVQGEFAVERIYTFLAIRVDEPDLTTFCHDNADEVASWFTGHVEGESHERNLTLVGSASNISQRGYERIFMRWTDGLALYDRTVNDDDYRNARCRAAQLFEHCILARRIFRTDGEKIARLSSSQNFFVSFPWRFAEANRALSTFSSAEYEMVISPPVGFVEAEELVDQAIKRCGVLRLIRDTRKSYDLLDRRLQLARGQWLAIVAFVAFLANAVIAIWFARK
jgi:hypothetical protein